MTKKYITIFILLSFLCTLCGCGQYANDVDNIEELIKEHGSENNIVDFYSGSVVKYSITDMASTHKYFSESNYFCYSCPQFTGFYTAGDSLEYGFVIFQLEDETFHLLYQCPDRVGVFPLAETEDYLIFAECFYDEDDLPIDYRVISYDESSKKINEYENTSGLISDGVIIKETLYYTSYEEQSDSYKCYQLDLENLRSVPEEVEGWDSSENRLLAYNDSLINVSDNIIKIGDYSVTCGDIYIVGNQLINCSVDSNMQYIADIYNLDTGEKEYTADSPIGFSKVEDNNFVLVCEGDIYSSND